MPLIRSISRTAVGAGFVTLGWDALLEPGSRARKAAALGFPEPDLVVSLNGGAMVVAGVALAAGLAPRLSAAVLAGLLVPTTLAGHPYWSETDPATRSRQRTQFIKNVCMFAGLVEVVLSGPVHRDDER